MKLNWKHFNHDIENGYSKEEALEAAEYIANEIEVD